MCWWYFLFFLSLTLSSVALLVWCVKQTAKSEREGRKERREKKIEGISRPDYTYLNTFAHADWWLFVRVFYSRCVWYVVWRLVLRVPTLIMLKQFMFACGLATTTTDSFGSHLHTLAPPPPPPPRLFCCCVFFGTIVAFHSYTFQFAMSFYFRSSA